SGSTREAGGGSGPIRERRPRPVPQSSKPLAEHAPVIVFYIVIDEESRGVDPVREHADNETTEGRVAPHEDEEISGVTVDRERAAERGRRAGLMGHTDSGDVAEYSAGFIEAGEHNAFIEFADIT